MNMPDNNDSVFVYANDVVEKHINYGVIYALYYNFLTL